jgi:ABC-type Co2+ transport system permease subunit
MSFQGLERELSELKAQFDLQEVLKRGIKYLIEGICVALAAFYIPGRTLELQEIMLLAVTAAATFAILDMYAPSIGAATRQGAGFGVGANLVGFPAMGSSIPKPFTRMIG